MRNIKFRGRDYKGKWHYGALVASEHYAGLITFVHTPKSECVHVDMETVGQFTGMKDKDGKEIYEDDIVRWYECVGAGAYRKYDTPVCYYHGAFRPVDDIFNVGYADDDCEISILDCEVIGNIHDNPELLE